MPSGNAGLARIFEGKRQWWNGCQFYKDCADCPFPDCLIESVTGRLWLSQKRNKGKVISVMRDWGKTNQEIAEALHFKIEQVIKYLANK